MEAEHFVRIADAEPTRARPLQGLWKVLPPLYAELAHLSLRNVPPVLFLLQSLMVPISCLLSARGVAGENRTVIAYSCSSSLMRARGPGLHNLHTNSHEDASFTLGREPHAVGMGSVPLH